MEGCFKCLLQKKRILCSNYSTEVKLDSMHLVYYKQTEHMVFRASSLI